MDYNKSQVEFIGVEAGGPKNSKLHACWFFGPEG